jgi:hypothetical protein
MKLLMLGQHCHLLILLQHLSLLLEGEYTLPFSILLTSLKIKKLMLFFFVQLWYQQGIGIWISFVVIRWTGVFSCTIIVPPQYLMSMTKTILDFFCGTSMSYVKFQCIFLWFICASVVRYGYLIFLLYTLNKKNRHWI